MKPLTKKGITKNGRIARLEELVAHYESEMLAARRERDELEVTCMQYRAEIKRLRNG